MKKQTGFTLIELLVVIAIIGVLAAVVLVSLNSARGKARNVRRNSDIKQLVTAFNLALDANGGPVASGGNWACISISCYGSISGYPANSTVDAFFGSYIQKPTDPSAGGRSAGGYLYAWSAGPYTAYDGSILEAGAFLVYFVEPPFKNDSCGAGSIYVVTSDTIQCLLKLY